MIYGQGAHLLGRHDPTVPRTVPGDVGVYVAATLPSPAEGTTIFASPKSRTFTRLSRVTDVLRLQIPMSEICGAGTSVLSDTGAQFDVGACRNAAAQGDSAGKLQRLAARKSHAIV